MDRMTDEEIRDIERALWGFEGVMINHARKLLQALKAERECIRATAAEALLDEIAEEVKEMAELQMPIGLTLAAILDKRMNNHTK